MTIDYSDIQRRIIDELNTNERTKYYFAIRTKMNSKEFSKWKVFVSSFVMSGSFDNSLHGEFLSSSWFKIDNPASCECAIIKISINTNDAVSRNKSTFDNLTDVINKMNVLNVWLPGKTDNIAMIHSINEEYLDDITHLLKTQMRINNNEFSTIHSSMNNEKGIFGLSFGMRKGGNLCMYCPNFTLSF